jgi:hypothetical protein
MKHVKIPVFATPSSPCQSTLSALTIFIRYQHLKPPIVTTMSDAKAPEPDKPLVMDEKWNDETCDLKLVSSDGTVFYVPLYYVQAARWVTP